MLFALAEAEDHHRRRTEVHAVGGEEGEVGRHAVELGHEHADPRGPRRHLDLEQLLGREREHELVVERREVVHAGDVGAALHVGQLLAGLLHPGVEVADDRLRAQHDLAVELEHEAQHAVGAGVLRPHVDDHRLVVGELGVDVVGQVRNAQHRALLSERSATSVAERGADLLLPLVGLRGRDRCSAHDDWAACARGGLELHGDAADRIVLAQRVTLPVVGHEDAGEIGVAGEDDAEHVVRLALHRLGAGVDVEQRRRASGRFAGTWTRSRTRLRSASDSRLTTTSNRSGATAGGKPAMGVQQVVDTAEVDAHREAVFVRERAHEVEVTARGRGTARADRARVRQRRRDEPRAPRRASWAVRARHLRGRPDRDASGFDVHAGASAADLPPARDLAGADHLVQGEDRVDAASRAREGSPARRRRRARSGRRPARWRSC